MERIACTYASTGLTGLTGGSSPTLAIYINGAVDACDNQTTNKIPTNAATPTAIGAREPSSGSTLTSQLVGGVDDVHVLRARSRMATSVRTPETRRAARPVRPAVAADPGELPG